MHLVTEIKTCNSFFFPSHSKWTADRVWQLIPAAWEATIGRITVWGQLGQGGVNRRILVQPGPDKKTQDPTWKITKAKKRWGLGSSGRVPAEQAWSPEYKTHIKNNPKHRSKRKQTTATSSLTSAAFFPTYSFSLHWPSSSPCLFFFLTWNLAAVR
jgi:hypothetical protein